MKISREQAESSLRYLRETPQPATPIELPEVSSEAVERVLESWGGNDDHRQAMVDEIQNELGRDEYEVPTDWVAEKLVGRLVSDRLR